MGLPRGAPLQPQVQPLHRAAPALDQRSPSWPFYLPLIALGVHPAALAFCSSVNLVYQFWIHTERVDRLPRPLEFIFNTPSHHRVHHASQGGYLDRNFGGILIVWDRLFGSFTAETERPVYGLTKNIATYNPLRVATHEYAAIARDLAAAASWRDRVAHLVRGRAAPQAAEGAAVGDGSVEAARGPRPDRASRWPASTRRDTAGRRGGGPEEREPWSRARVPVPPVPAAAPRLRVPEPWAPEDGAPA